MIAAHPGAFAATARSPGGYGIRPYGTGVDARHRPGGVRRHTASAGEQSSSESITLLHRAPPAPPLARMNANPMKLYIAATNAIAGKLHCFTRGTEKAL